MISSKKKTQNKEKYRVVVYDDGSVLGLVEECGSNKELSLIITLIQRLLKLKDFGK